jgi:hypothetical protein
MNRWPPTVRPRGKQEQGQEQAAIAQGKQQRAMTALTVALVECALAYTCINAWVVYEMHEGNKTQSQVAPAAKWQASAAHDANEIQRTALQMNLK